jgi:hypothetical protein
LTARSRWQPRLVFDEDVTVCIKMTCAHIGVIYPRSLEPRATFCLGVTGHKNFQNY